MTARGGDPVASVPSNGPTTARGGDLIAPATSGDPTTARGRLLADLRQVRAVLPLLGVDRRRTMLAIAWGSLTLSAAVGLAAVSAWLIARASQMPHVLDLTVAVVTVRALGISRGVFRYLDRITSHDVALRGVATLRERLYTALASGRAEAVLGLRRGDLLSRLGADADAIGDVVVRALVPAAVAAVVSTGSVLLVGAFSPAAGAVLALCLLVSGVGAPMLAAKATRAAEVALTEDRAELSAAVTTVLDGATELRVNGGIAAATGHVAAVEERLRRGRDRAAGPAAAAHALVLLATGVATVAALLIGIGATAGGSLAPVELAVVVLTPLAAFEASAALPAAAVQLTRSAAAARRVRALLDAARPAGSSPADWPSVRARCHSSSGPGQPERRSPAPTGRAVPHAGVVAQNLACGWDGRTVVTGIDLHLEPGRAVVVAGPSGAGKTTLALTLAGLIPPVVGTLDITGGAPTEVVTFTAEDAHLFETTVLENLRVARGDVSSAEAEDALARVGLSTLVSRLPHGLDTIVGAPTLSGGERRRLLLARALLSPAPLLILDEPTEHLDPATAAALMTDILTLGRDRGVLVITHQHTGCEAADQVIRIDGSRTLVS
ncbi:thiol reductant ABC exporter subunit CydC [Ruania alba]|uniref:ATP-binding cassette, subfamily C, CydC n=1 Tax=Ruania alba TaxID=648782 RepID=A0A1H5HBW7_9MICO|nr:thiol reductant ABC exporter subunit CydC [Ruania alba]SEE25335.1 ATP-binding cassette, subfamily C, CydC [Ruania alba]